MVLTFTLNHYETIEDKHPAKHIYICNIHFHLVENGCGPTIRLWNHHRNCCWSRKWLIFHLICVFDMRTNRTMCRSVSLLFFFLFFFISSVRLTMLNGRYQMLIDMQTDGLEPLYNVTWDYRFRYNYDEWFDVTRVFWERFISWAGWLVWWVAYMVFGIHNIL